MDDRGQECALEDNRLYSVVSDLYTGQMLSSITGISHGLLSLQPKDAEGNPLENFEDAILFSGGQEMKAWVAIARYLSSFEQTTGGLPRFRKRTQKSRGERWSTTAGSRGNSCETPIDIPPRFTAPGACWQFLSYCCFWREFSCGETEEMIPAAIAVGKTA